MDNNQKKALYEASKITTGTGIISYANLWEPRADGDDKTPKYSTSFLIPKSDVNTLKKISNAIEAAARLGEATKWNGKRPTPLTHPLRNGDDVADEKGEIYRGCYFVNAKSVRKPEIVNFQGQHITDRDQVYSGCVCRLSLNFYPFEHKGNKGVACGLGNVQKIEDGEPLGTARSSAKDDFADVSDLDLPFDEPATPAVTSNPAAAAPTGEDILSKIGFGNSAA